MATTKAEDVEAQHEEENTAEEGSMSGKVGQFFKKNFNKGELALKHAAGLGRQPSAVPNSEPVIDGPPRTVEVGWHPVGGLAGKWFAEQTGLGKLITEKINKYPDPTQHWAVLVGDYAHQLWMDENFDVIYTNEKIKREEWRTFTVGETKFNDDATRRAGEAVIESIREKQPAYNLITNNCQTYALQLLDAIKVGSNKEFGTTLTVYERLIGPGRVKDLFVNSTQAGGQFQLGDTGPENTVSLAHQVMHENTTQLDTEQQMHQTDDASGHARGEAFDSSRDTDSMNAGERSNKKERSKTNRVRNFFSGVLK